MDAATQLVVAHGHRCLHALGQLLSFAVLYSVTLRGFDGAAWNASWFKALNYGALGLAFAWIVGARRSDP